MFPQCFLTDLVQRPHRHLGDVVGDELPARALRVAGGDTLSVPQVTCRWRERGSGAEGKDFNIFFYVAATEYFNLELFTVVIHGENGRPAHRELSEGLPGGRRDVIPAFSCWGRKAGRGSHRHFVRQVRAVFVTFFFCLPFRALTCWVLWRDGPSVEHLPVPGDGPHLVGSADGDGLEGLVGAHVEPGASLPRTVSQDLTASVSNPSTFQNYFLLTLISRF